MSRTPSSSAFMSTTSSTPTTVSTSSTVTPLLTVTTTAAEGSGDKERRPSRFEVTKVETPSKENKDNELLQPESPSKDTELLQPESTSKHTELLQPESPSKQNESTVTLQIDPVEVSERRVLYERVPVVIVYIMLVVQQRSYILQSVGKFCFRRLLGSHRC